LHKYDGIRLQRHILQLPEHRDRDTLSHLITTHLDLLRSYFVHMACSSFNFKLSSTQTALAVVVPYSHSGDIDALRSVHDKSFRKWPPHLNILYPFVDPEHLESALEDWSA
jgi:hypothetical protein